MAKQGNRPPAVHRPAPPPSGSEAGRPKDKASTRMGNKLINAKMPKGQQASNRSLLEEKKSKDHTEREAGPLLNPSRIPPPQHIPMYNTEQVRHGLLHSARAVAYDQLARAFESRHLSGYEERLAAAYAGIAAAYWAIAAEVSAGRVPHSTADQTDRPSSTDRHRGDSITKRSREKRCNQRCTYQVNYCQYTPEYCCRLCVCQDWSDHGDHGCAHHAKALPTEQQERHLLTRCPFGDTTYSGQAMQAAWTGVTTLATIVSKAEESKAQAFSRILCLGSMLRKVLNPRILCFG